MEGLSDPCPLPAALLRRSLNEQERRIYAPMSDLDGFIVDRDAVYVEIPDWKVHHSGQVKQSETEGDRMIRSLQSLTVGFDERLNETRERLFESGDNTGATSLVQHQVALETASSEDDEESAIPSLTPGVPRYETIEHDGRERKRVLFDSVIDKTDDTVRDNEPPSNKVTSEDDSENDWNAEDRGGKGKANMSMRILSGYCRRRMEENNTAKNDGEVPRQLWTSSVLRLRQLRRYFINVFHLSPVSR